MFAHLCVYVLAHLYVYIVCVCGFVSVSVWALWRPEEKVGVSQPWLLFGTDEGPLKSSMHS